MRYLYDTQLPLVTVFFCGFIFDFFIWRNKRRNSCMFVYVFSKERENKMIVNSDSSQIIYYVTRIERNHSKKRKFTTNIILPITAALNVSLLFYLFLDLWNRWPWINNNFIWSCKRLELQVQHALCIGIKLKQTKQKYIGVL